MHHQPQPLAGSNQPLAVQYSPDKTAAKNKKMMIGPCQLLWFHGARAVLTYTQHIQCKDRFPSHLDQTPPCSPERLLLEMSKIRVTGVYLKNTAHNPL